MSMTSGVIKVEKKSEGVWAVYGTPADAAVIGLVHILRDTPPDLVVSGTNAGAEPGIEHEQLRDRKRRHCSNPIRRPGDRDVCRHRAGRR